MKRVIKTLAFSVALMSFVTVTHAQVTASATATATIVTPIAIANASDMNFGNLAVSTTAGTVVLTPAGTRTATGGVSFLTGTPGTVTAASFTVTGLDGATYSITLPAAALTITSGANTMTVDTWTSNPTPTGTLTGGTETLNVGATLNVAGSQPAGTYVSGTPFDVTVNYN